MMHKELFKKAILGIGIMLIAAGLIVLLVTEEVAVGVSFIVFGILQLAFAYVMNVEYRKKTGQ